MKKILKFKVTKEHIVKGIKESRNSCPIAKATREFLGNKKKIEVTNDTIIIDNKYIYDLDEKAQSFITYFDGNGEVKPFTAIATLDETITLR